MIEEKLRKKVINRLIESVVGVRRTGNKRMLVCSGGTVFYVLKYENFKKVITIINSDVGETVFEIDNFEYSEIQELYSKLYEDASLIKAKKHVDLLMNQTSL